VYLAPGYDVIELGCSIGANTTQILKRLHRNRKLVAVEADPSLCAVLAGNIELNFGRAPHCHIVNAAVSYTEGQRVGFRIGQTSLQGRIDPSTIVDDRGMTVPCTTLSKLISEYGIGEYILVADIEGAEAAIFVKDPESLTNCYRIVIEIDGGVVDGVFYSISRLMSILSSCGFSLLHRHGNRMVFQRTERLAADALL
jgi:FkbM family methyltransferase